MDGSGAEARWTTTTPLRPRHTWFPVEPMPAAAMEDLMKQRRIRPLGDPVALVPASIPAPIRRFRKLALPVVASLLVASLTGCVDDADDTDGLPTGPPDQTPVATRYGAIGNSLTAGYINGGLVEGGQKASYPVLLSVMAGWDTPALPLILSPGIGSTPGQSAISVSATGGLVTVPVNPLALLHPQLSRLPRPYDNLGIPGATTLDLLNAKDATTSQAGNNLFFDLILRNSAIPPGGYTVLDATEARNPNAITLWIGNNDILGGALGGNPVVGGNITPPAVWEQLFNSVLARIDAMNPSYVAVANIPNIVDIPYVTTIPPAFPFGQNLLPFNTDEDDVEYVLLPFGLIAATNPDTLGTYLEGFGTNSLPSHWTLTQSEAEAITATAVAYNTIIQSACAARGWAYVDISSELAVLPNDVFAPNFDVVNGLFPWFPLFGSGGVTFIRNELAAFSLDGVHPSEIGQALLANAFARALTATYADLTIPEIPLNAISNRVGFENAPSGVVAPGSNGSASTSAAATEGALHAIETMPTLLGLGQ